MKKPLLTSLLAAAAVSGLILAVFAIRQARAGAEIEREWSVAPAAMPGLETTARLEIVPLYDEDRAGDDLIYGHGVSYLVRTDSASILLDVGNNPSQSALSPVVQNMQTLGIGWEEIDSIVISHPHPDHLGGVEAWQNQTISLGDSTAQLSEVPVYAPIPMTIPGVNVIHSGGPTQISPAVATTGAIAFPEVFPMFLFNPKGSEQGLVVDVAGEGLVLITGCGHPTLEKLVARAEAVFSRPVVGVVGGLHYEAASAEDLQPHIKFLGSRQPRLVALSPHDSGPQVIEIVEAAFPTAYQFVRLGETIRFP